MQIRRTHSHAESKERAARSGLSLVEVIISLLVFSAGGLGLAASSAAIVKQMGRTAVRAKSASSALVRDESFHGAQCDAIAGGSLTAGPLRSAWVVSPGTVTTLDQTVTRSMIVDTYLSAVRCE
jgi:Tfp pilus assembly protein PilV